MNNNIFRINDFSIMKFIDTTDPGLFNIVVSNADDKQYVLDLETSILKTVWDFDVDGLDTRHRLNKTFSNPPLVDNFTNKEVYPITQVEIMLRQGYSFTTLFGLLITIKSLNTNETLLSEIVYESDFSITSNKELINGSFWMESVILNIPKLDNNLFVEITEISYTDIDPIGESIGLIWNYPNTFIPLVPETETPEFINNYINYDNNLFFEFGVNTTQNKTLEQSILDYFNQDIANITISHEITYGIELLGYSVIEISNTNNKYNPIKIGLDFSQYINNSDVVEITVHLTTKIYVDGKLMQRDTEIIVNLTSLLQPYIDKHIVHPTTNYPVEIVEEIVNNQTIIETNERIKVVKLYEKIFAEIVNSDFVYESKNITFTNITIPCYMEIDSDIPQLVDSQTTSDNVIYFDISSILPITEDTKYSVKQYESNMLIQEGFIRTK